MTKKAEQIIDVEVMEDNRTETQDFAELNAYKNELVAKNREITKQEELVKASINEFIGMTKAQALTENFNKTLRTLKLLELKNNNLYKNITFIDFEGNPRQVTNWEDFCKAIGTSKSSVEEDIKNLITFGQNFMQLCETKGITIRELRRMRQNMQNPMLSEQEKLALSEAKQKDPQELLGMLEDLQDKQISMEEKQKTLEKTVKELKKENEAKTELIKHQSERINNLSPGETEAFKQEEKNRLFNTLENEFAKNISSLQNAKVAFLEALRLQENGKLDEQENERFDDSVLQFLTNVMRFSSEVRSGKYNFLNAADNLGLLPLFSLYIEQNTPKFESPDFENPDNE